MSAYSGLASGQYTSMEVMDEMRQSGYYPTNHAVNVDYLPSATQPDYDTVRSDIKAADAYASYSYPAKLASEAPSGYDKSKMMSMQSESEMSAGFQDSGQFAGIYDGAVDVQYKEKRVLEQRLLEVGHQVVTGMRPIYTYEKVVEVPQVIIKETEREVIKPEIIERILEVPKTEIRERTIVGPPQVMIEEQIVEVPQIVYEERVIHVPRREIQERLIEVPKVEYVYRDEYEDHVEYREVIVDKIVEVPEIEYRVKEVEQLVPQTYIQEYYVDRYKEVPITQVQEVERIEEVPVMVPRSQYGAVMAQRQQASQMQEAQYAQQQAQYSQQAQFAQQQQAHYAQMQASQMQEAQYSQQAQFAQQQQAHYAQMQAQYAQQQQQQAQYAQQQQQQAMLQMQNSSNAYSAYDPHKAATRPGDIFDAIDGNRDGVVTREEYNQFQENMIKSMASAPVGTTFAVPRGTFTPPGSCRSMGMAQSMPPMGGPMPSMGMMPMQSSQSMTMPMSVQSMQVPGPPVNTLQTQQYGVNPFASAASMRPGY